MANRFSHSFISLLVIIGRGFSHVMMLNIVLVTMPDMPAINWRVWNLFGIICGIVKTN